ncbi:MAG TPA: choice-of-anchor D domain-containing protein [Kofleriaceae bacterium]|jgi:hypothetical protein
MRRVVILMLIAMGCGGSGGDAHDAMPIDARASDAAPDAARDAPPDAAPDAPGAPDLRVVDATTGAPLTDVTFPTVLVNGAAQQTVAVTNAGTATALHVTVSTSGAPFSLLVTTCANATLGPGATCTATVRYASTTAGDADGNFVAASGASTATLLLHASAFAPALAFDPPALDFGTSTSGDARQLTISLANAAAATVPIDSIAAAAPFSQVATTCGATLAAGATCTITVGYDAAQLGAQTGALTVHSDGFPFTAALSAGTGRSLTVARSGTGGGTVASADASIACGGTCTALVTAAVTLTATPDAGSVFAGWTYAGCGAAPTCTVPLAAAPTTVTAQFYAPSADGFWVVFAGDGPGEVAGYTDNPETYSPQFRCTSTCFVPAAAGVVPGLTAASQDAFEGITGACSSTGLSAYCSFTEPAAGAVVVVTFAADPHDRWLSVIQAGSLGNGEYSNLPFDDVAFDSDGDVIATGEFVTAGFSPAGTMLWEIQPGASHVVAGPDHTAILVRDVDGLTPELVKIDTHTGTALWPGPLQPPSSWPALGLAVAPDGSITYSSDYALDHFDADGNEQWSVLGGFATTRVDATGRIYARSAPGIEVFDELGNPGPTITGACPHSTGDFAVDATGAIACASWSSNVRYLDRAAAGGTPLWTRSATIPLGTSDVPVGAGLASNGVTAWFYDERIDAVTAWLLGEYDAAGTPIWTVHHDALLNDYIVPTNGYSGSSPQAFAVDANGNIAVVGMYWGPARDGYSVQLFSP